jgi:DUF1680 family protein
LHTQKRPFNKLSPIPFHQVEITDNFWAKRQKLNRDVSIHAQHAKLEAHHHINNFRVAARIKEGVFRGEFFLDSDLYKWLQAASHILQLHPDSKLQSKVKEIINLIQKAQLKDGYLNTFFQLNFLNKRLSNWYNAHELYCVGHLIEAAIAHYQATGSRVLLRVAEKFSDFLVKVYLNGKRDGVPGHEEIELALIALYCVTLKKQYLSLAKEFIDRRGYIRNYRGKGLFQIFDGLLSLRRSKKKIARFDDQHHSTSAVNETPQLPQIEQNVNVRLFLRFFWEHWSGRYAQLNCPVREARAPVGHAVRAMYLYCGMADLYAETGEPALLDALQRVWRRMLKYRMYITGGIGAVSIYEGFGRDFELPNEGSYSETCAAIGSILWSWRLLQITAQCKYADLIERTLYNGFLVGQSIDGLRYSYNNPLISYGADSRNEWYAVACCPPNVARTIASLGKLIYSMSSSGVWVHQYIGNKVIIPHEAGNEIKLTLDSEFPWQGIVKLTLGLKQSQNFPLHLRIPEWSATPEVYINTQRYDGAVKQGTYADLSRTWTDQDVVELRFPMEPQLKTSDPRIKDNIGRLALVCGPLIYCLEQLDNTEDIFELEIARSPRLLKLTRANLLGGIDVIQGRSATDKLFTAIPYYAWGNRGTSKMLIWVKKRSE